LGFEVGDFLHHGAEVDFGLLFESVHIARHVEVEVVVASSCGVARLASTMFPAFTRGRWAGFPRCRVGRYRTNR
jgi:hypothetical protein